MIDDLSFIDFYLILISINIRVKIKPLTWKVREGRKYTLNKGREKGSTTFISPSSNLLKELHSLEHLTKWPNKVKGGSVLTNTMKKPSLLLDIEKYIDKELTIQSPEASLERLSIYREALGICVIIDIYIYKLMINIHNIQVCFQRNLKFTDHFLQKFRMVIAF